MTALHYTPPTKRRAMTKARRTGIYIARDGVCGICRQRIRAGELYEIEHPDCLEMGGSDDDADLWPVHVRCHKGKTAADRKLIAKRNSIIDQGYAGPEKRKHPIPGSRASGIRKRMNGSIERW